MSDRIWARDTPQPEDLLRQGDLILNVPFPVLKVEPEIDPNHNTAVVRMIRRPAIVVSQCCTTQNRSVAELAAVVRTGKISADSPMVRGLMQPYPAKSGQVFYDGMWLEPLGSVVPGERAEGRYHHISFAHRVTFNGDLTWLQIKRAARMTPVGRRDLRMRLGAWYSRVEAEDEKLLKHAGEIAGFADMP